MIASFAGALVPSAIVPLDASKSRASLIVLDIPCDYLYPPLPPLSLYLPLLSPHTLCCLSPALVLWLCLKMWCTEMCLCLVMQ